MTPRARSIRQQLHRPFRGRRGRLRRRVAAAGALVLGGSLLVVGTAAPPAGAASGTFDNTGLITLPAGAPGTTIGNANPYPSSISVTGLTGVITDVNVTLTNIGHTHPDDLDILLVSPSGDSVVLMSDACNGTDFEDFDWTFDDEATGPMPDSPAGTCSSFFYQPSSYDSGSDTWPGSNPGPHGSALSTFDGENPLGTWSLYASDDAAGDSGDIEGGWSLTITTGPSNIDIPASGTTGNASPYPRTVTVSSNDLVTDVDVTFNGITHAHPDDMDILMVGPSGASTILMSDACGSFNVTNYLWEWDDEAPGQMADSGSTNVCGGFVYQPTNIGTGDTWPSPAPASGYGSSLSVHDLGPAGGNWSFYIVDDTGGDAGFLINVPTLQLTTRPRAATKFSAATVNAAEGDNSAVLTITRSAAGSMAGASVTVTSTPGTAGAGDFQAINQVVGFGPGETSKNVPITIVDDAAGEGPETFTVSLSAPTGDSALTAPSSATVTIAASDGGAPAADTTAPETIIGKAPGGLITKRKVKIVFSSSEAGSTFQCKIKSGPWKSCKSPLKLKNLALGKYKVLIRATDAAGNVDPKPAKVKWKVIAQP